MIARACAVQHAKDLLLDLLPREHRRTVRTPAGRAPKTFEDWAAESQDRGVRGALTAFQNALNHLWIEAIGAGLDERVARVWMAARRPGGHVDRDDVRAEVWWSMRGALAAFDPRGQDRPNVEAYVGTHCFRDLDAWHARQGLQVDLPRRALRAGERPGQVEVEALADELRDYDLGQAVLEFLDEDQLGDPDLMRSIRGALA